MFSFHPSQVDHMAKENPKLLKVADFRPNLTDQNDKRNLKRARDDLECLVTKSYNNLAFPCFAGVPVLDPKRGVVGMEIFAMAGPLKDFFTDDLRESLKQDQNLVGIVVNDIMWQDKISMMKDYHNIDNDEIDWWCF